MAQAAAQTAQGDKLASLQAGVAMIQQQLKNAFSPKPALKKLTPPANRSTRRCTKPFRSRKPPKFPKAMSPADCAKATNCATACCARPPSSSPKNRRQIP
jgi:hypothetical protein